MNGKFNPYQYIQKKLKEGIHPEIVFKALKTIRDRWADIRGDPWAYTGKMVKDGQLKKEHEGYKKTLFDPKIHSEIATRIKEIMAGIGQAVPQQETEKRRKAQLQEQVAILRCV